MGSQYEVFVGQEINGLKIIRFFRADNGRGSRKRSFYECLCICGKLFVSRADHIRSGLCKSCGCISVQLTAAAHVLPNNRGAINDVYRGYKSNARNRNLSFCLTPNEFEFLIFKDCFYCGTLPATRTWKVDKAVPYSLSCNGIDRLNSNLGYSIDNCVPCCPQCNFAKSNLSLEDFRKWIAQLVEFSTRVETI